MPRARAHIASLLEKYISTQQSIKTLEDQIEQAKTGQGRPVSSSPESIPQHQVNQPSAWNDPDEWLKSEEQEIRRLEMEIIKRKKTASASTLRARASHDTFSAAPTSPELLTNTTRPIGVSPETPLQSVKFPGSSRGGTHHRTSPLKHMNPMPSPLKPMNHKTSPLKTPHRTPPVSTPRSKNPTLADSPTTAQRSHSTMASTSLAAKINAMTPKRPSGHTPGPRRVTSYSVAPQDESTNGPTVGLLGGGSQRIRPLGGSTVRPKSGHATTKPVESPLEAMIPQPTLAGGTSVNTAGGASANTARNVSQVASHEPLAHSESDETRPADHAVGNETVTPTTSSAEQQQQQQHPTAVDVPPSSVNEPAASPQQQSSLEPQDDAGDTTLQPDTRRDHQNGSVGGVEINKPEIAPAIVSPSPPPLGGFGN